MADVCAVGPYLLQHVLGKGQTGKVIFIFNIHVDFFFQIALSS